MKTTTFSSSPTKIRALVGFVMTLCVMITVPTKAATQPLAPVDLKSTSNFVVLAGSKVSNIPGSAITGDIGLSPAAGSNISGFGSLEVTGKVYTVDATGPAGSITAANDLLTAKGDLTIAYNDAAGRTPVPAGPFLNPGAGDISGLTLVPGLYKFTSRLSILSSDLTLNGNMDDVWIFQIATDLIVGNDVKVILAGGAQAANIFWQVGTSATLGTTSVFKGTILADQSISLNTGASLEGRALASIAAVTLASNAIVRPIRKTAGAILMADKKSGYSIKQAAQSLIFTVPTEGHATLKLISAKGEMVEKLFEGSVNAGYQSRVELGLKSGISGVCYAQLEFNGDIKITKLLFLN